jgi:hypothetical protein
MYKNQMRVKKNLIKLFLILVFSSVYLNAEYNILTDKKIDDYFINETGEKMIYIKVNPNNETIEEGYVPVTNIVEYDLKNHTEKILLKGCDSQSVFASGCYYSDPILSNDNKTLYYARDQWVTSKGVYKLDLNTLQDKFITPGSNFQVIKDGKYKDYMVVNKHKYFEKGGSYDQDVLVTPDGEEISAINNRESFVYYKSKIANIDSHIANLVDVLFYEWDKAHNEKNLNTFNAIYSDTLNYYNSKKVNKSFAIKDKKKLFNKFVDFHQTSNLVGVESLKQNSYKLNYKKNVTYGSNKRTFSSYLIIKIDNNKPIVIEEND